MSKTPLLGLGVLAACGPAGFDTLPDTGDDEVGDGDGDSGDGDGDSGEVGDGDGDTLDEETTDEGETDGGPFELLAGQFEDPDTIVLTFSNPLGAFASVDPTSFRISLGFTTTYIDPYEGTLYGGSYYWDPNYIGYGYYYYYDYFRVNSLSSGPQPHQLRLGFETPLVPGVCPLIAQNEPQPPMIGEIGLYTHYAPGGVPLRDSLGVALAPIGPEWVDVPYNYSYSFDEPGFPNLDPKVEIPCPF